MPTRNDPALYARLSTARPIAEARAALDAFELELSAMRHASSHRTEPAHLGREVVADTAPADGEAPAPISVVAVAAAHHLHAANPSHGLSSVFEDSRDARAAEPSRHPPQHPHGRGRLELKMRVLDGEADESGAGGNQRASARHSRANSRASSDALSRPSSSAALTAVPQLEAPSQPLSRRQSRRNSHDTQGKPRAEPPHNSALLISHLHARAEASSGVGASAFGGLAALASDEMSGCTLGHTGHARVGSAAARHPDGGRQAHTIELL